MMNNEKNKTITFGGALRVQGNNHQYRVVNNILKNGIKLNRCVSLFVTELNENCWSANKCTAFFGS